MYYDFYDPEFDDPFDSPEWEEDELLCEEDEEEILACLYEE